MARYTDAVCRLCRREAQKLFLKGERCYSDKCAMNRRAHPPGQHGKSRKKLSEYGLQLREKQKARRYYGVLENQFRRYFVMAEKKQGITGENLLQLLESRLDNVVYRLGFAMSRPEARQLVNHGHFIVNGRKVDIPSFLVSQGDTISVRPKSKTSEKFKVIADKNDGRPVPGWLQVDRENQTATVLKLPSRDQIDLEIAETLIVELYSK